MDSVLSQAATQDDPNTFLQAARARMQGQTMAHHALDLVRQGRTTLAEALRVSFEAQDPLGQE